MILISCARLSNFKGSLASAGLCLGIPLYRDWIIESNLFLQLTAFVERYWLHSHRLVNLLVHDKCGRMTWQGTVSRVQTGEEAPLDPSEVRKRSPKIRSVDAPYETTKLLRGGKAKWACRSCPYPGFPYLGDACDSLLYSINYSLKEQSISDYEMILRSTTAMQLAERKTASESYHATQQNRRLN